MQDNLEVKLKFEKQMDRYKDSYFKFLVTMVRNVFCFRTVNTNVLRKLVY